MKIKLIKETKVGARVRPPGLVMDVTAEKASEMIAEGVAVPADFVVKKKKNV